jgi:predicted amidohydrolase YtcJ
MFLIVALFYGLFAPLADAQIADWLLTNSRIYTVDPARPSASQLAIKDGRILAVGDDLSRHAGPSTRRTDLKGATVVPGFIDSHAHLENFGDMLENFDLRQAKTMAEIAAIVAKAAATRPETEWVRGRAWDQTNWGGTLPTADQLPNTHPVYLTRVDGHAGWANRKALALAGITKETRDPPGGKIIRDANGEATGVLIDRAQALVTRHIPPPTLEQSKRRLLRAAQECARLGLTTIHDAGVGAQTLRAYKQLMGEPNASAGTRPAFPLRVYAMIGGRGPLWDEYRKKGPEIGPQLTVRAIKLVADGAMGSGGAAFFQDYSDEKGNSGLLILDRPEIEAVARQAAAAGFQVATHAIGDRANRAALEAYAAVLPGKNDKRFRIEHAQVVSLADFALFRDYSVIASIQATHATSDMRWAEKRLGPDRLAGAYAWRKFLSMGIHMPNGSDFPVEDANPLWGFYASVTRQDHQGNPPGGWRPDQKLSRAEALQSWTLEGAYAAFEENQKGSLTPGKLADFVVLSKDILTVPPAEILKTSVVMTVLGGSVVWERKSD